MAEIRFKNLPKLLSSMKKKEWIIDSFLFNYKKEDYVVILKLYNDTERKPSEYAKVKLEFIRANNINESIQVYADFYEVHFNSLNEFVRNESAAFAEFKAEEAYRALEDNLK